MSSRRGIMKAIGNGVIGWTGGYLASEAVKYYNVDRSEPLPRAAVETFYPDLSNAEEEINTSDWLKEADAYPDHLDEDHYTAVVEADTATSLNLLQNRKLLKYVMTSVLVTMDQHLSAHTSQSDGAPTIDRYDISLSATDGTATAYSDSDIGVEAAQDSSTRNYTIDLQDEQEFHKTIAIDWDNTRIPIGYL